MSGETVGLHTQLTADSGNFTASMERARKQLASFAVEQTKLRSAIQAAEKELADQSQKFGKNSNEAKKAAEALESLYKENLDLKDKVQDVTNKINEQTQAFAKSASEGKKVTSATDQIKNGLTALKGIALGYAGKTLYEALIGSNADFEQSMVSFEVLLGSADKTSKLMDDLNKFGAQTPFELPEITEATTQLLVFGTAEEEVMGKLQQLGDLSMGNSEKLDRLTNAYGKMLAKGKVSLEELNMFTEAGVPILEELQNQYGVTQEKLFDMISAGKVNIEAINASMESMTNEGGRFYGMMEKQSQTFIGMLSTAADTVNIFARDVGEEAFGYLKEEFAALMQTINEMDENGELQAIASEIGEDVANAIRFVGDFVKTLWNMRDILVAGASAIATYKVSMSLLTNAASLLNTITTTANILSGKSVVCKNLETGATYTLTAAEAAHVTQTNASIVAQTKFNAVLNSNIYFAVASAILAIVSAFIAYNKASDEAADTTMKLCSNMDELKGSINDAAAASLSKAEIVRGLIPELETLANKTNRTEEENRKLNSIISQMNNAIPELKLAIDSETGALNTQISTIYGLCDAYKSLAMAKAAENLAAESYETYLKKRAEADQHAIETLEYAETHKEAFYFDEKAKRAKENRLKYKEAEKFEEQGDAYMELATEYRNKAGEYSEVFETNGNGTNNSTQKNTVTSTSTSDKSSSKKTASDIAKEEIDLLKWKQDMGYITEAQYYEGLAAIRDKYFTKNSAEWRKYTLEIKKGNESMYKDWLSSAKDYISDADSGKIEWAAGDDYATAVKRAMEKVEDYWKKGIIDYETYINDMSELDQSLREHTAETLKDAIEDEEKLLRDKYQNQYDMAVEAADKEIKLAEKKADAEIDAINAAADNEIARLDELIEKRREAREDADNNLKMQRLQTKLAYEHDEENRVALQKEIAKLQQEMDDIAFERSIEDQKEAIEAKRDADIAAAEGRRDDIIKLQESKKNTAKSDYEYNTTDYRIASELSKIFGFDEVYSVFKTYGDQLGTALGSIIETFVSTMDSQFKNIANQNNTYSSVNKYYNMTSTVASLAPGEVQTILKKFLNQIELEAL